jgi:NAD(P)-dependent dehydrogenase (short-subunit alcohol dehydrogenase family)
MTDTSSQATRGGDGLGALIGAKIFIVGAGSGVGRAIASMAVARGAKVALAGRSRDKLDATAATLGGAVLGVYALDVTDCEQVEAATAEHGPYDHIVTTAAELTFGPFTGLTDAQIEGMLASKFWGPINLGRAADKHLAPQGSLLFFSGLAAYRQGLGSSIVGAVNMALESLAAALAIELKPKRVNVISPGVVDAGSWSSMVEDERAAFFADVAGALPVGRIGEVEDEAHAALAIMENGFVNGTVVNVDGGGRIA